MVGENILGVFLAVPRVVGENILGVFLAVPRVVGENILGVFLAVPLCFRLWRYGRRYLTFVSTALSNVRRDGVI